MAVSEVAALRSSFQDTEAASSPKAQQQLFPLFKEGKGSGPVLEIIHQYQDDGNQLI